MALYHIGLRKIGLSPVRTPSLLSLFALWRSRRMLKSLDAAQLQDLGIDADMARKEAAKPLWDVPPSWLR